MAVVTLTDDEIELRGAVGTATLLQGRVLAQEGPVDLLLADAGTGQLRGRVGSGGQAHSVNARLHYRDGVLRVIEGVCSCGRAVPCPHTVALLLAGRSRRAEASGRRERARSEAAPVASAPQLPRSPAPWEAALDGSLRTSGADRPAPAAGRPIRSAGPTSTQRLALQFEQVADPRGRIAIRPVTAGQGGGWVRSGVSWSQLDYADYYYRQLPVAHVRLLKELRGLPSSGGRGYQERFILLDTISSRRVWDLLLEAAEIGLPLVMAGRRGEPVHVHGEPAVALLDVSRIVDDGIADDGIDGPLTIRSRLEVAGRPIADYLLLGDPHHGVAWHDGPGQALRLARLARAVHPLFTRLQGGQALQIPAADVQYFLNDYYPQLREQIEVACRDGSVQLPRPLPPVLELTATGLGGHRVELSWAWVYAIGASRRSEPLTVPSGPAPAGRDLAAEARITAAVVEAIRDLPGLVEETSTGARPVPGAVLEGVATARLMSETLPQLRDLPDVEVRLALEPGAPDYRAVDAVPVIRFTAGQDGQVAGQGGFAEVDWLDLAVTVTVDGHQVPFEELFVALAQEQTHLVLDNGVYFSLDRAEFTQLARLIAESRTLLDAPAATVRMNRFQAGLWDEVERLGEITGQVESWQESVRALSAAVTLPEQKVPDGLRATLRPYQEAGFGWLATLFAHRLGGILADDMGLGKTLQALALVQYVREQALSDEPFLVVAPTSVVAGWAAECARFAPDLSVVSITQTAARRGHDVAEAIAGADLVVTSYTLFRLEFEQYRARTWAGLLLDEAQNVKNHNSAGYRCAKQLPARFKLAITGTPMENNLMELWSLLSITAPGLFARADRFTEYYRTPIERERDGERLGQLRRRIRPLMLRRTKDQVAPDLPDRQEQVVELELGAKHRTVYAKYLQRERQKVLGLLGDLNRNRFEILRSLTLLRQASLDVALVDPAHERVPSTKLDALLDQLQGIIAEGHRVLVFSQFTRFLGRVASRLDAAGIEYCYLDGTTRNRPAVISKFRTGSAPVFLISLKAGGSGLNLTEADYVVLLDPWWNPATEAQAVDRAHRIGQTRKVMVYRLVAKDTIEEKVMALKDRKAALTASVLSGDDFASAALTADDIRGLLS